MGDRNSELFESIKQNPDDASSIEALESGLTEADWSVSSSSMRISERMRVSQPISPHICARLQSSRKFDWKIPFVPSSFWDSLGGDDDAVLETLADMRQLLKAIEDWDNYLEVATSWTLKTIPERRAELLFDIGSVLEVRQGIKNRPSNVFEAAFEADSNCHKALWAARRIYRDQKDWDLVARCFRLRWNWSPTIRDVPKSYGS